MKNTLKAALVILASAALTLSAKPEIKLIHSGIVCDTVVDALSPNGMAVNDRGEYLLTFQDQGDNSPSAHSYLTISKKISIINHQNFFCNIKTNITCFF